MAHRGDVALEPGTKVSGYEIRCLLGSGGMGSVYAGEEPTIGTRVAIKVLHAALSTDPTFAARFEREARAANDVRHPAFVEVFAFGRLDDGRPYLVMPLLEGRSLREELERRTKLSPREAWAIVREIAAALGAAHDAGIVHRDLKPDNIFLERVGQVSRVRLLDLGIAKLTRSNDLEEVAAKLTQTGTPIGTPIYMAPEQWWGTEIDGSVDQYALGISLFEMIAGTPPFRSAQFMELGQKHLHEAPPPLRTREPGTSDAIDAFVARALAKSPSERHASMTTFIEEGDRAFSEAESTGAGPKLTSTSPTLASEAASGSVSRPEVDLDLDVVSPFARTNVAPLTGADDDPRSGAREPPALAIGVGLFALSVGLLAAVGYAGSSRRHLARWFVEGGWPATAIGVIVLVGVALLVSRTFSRDVTLLRWGPASLAAIVGALGTYVGFERVATVERLESVERFVILNTGMYEVELSRFLGYYGSASLLVLVAASAGRRGALVVPQVGRRSTWVAAGLVFLLAVGSAWSGAPSGAMIASVAALLIALEAIAPLDAVDHAGRRERACAGILALVFTCAAGFARIDARDAATWLEQPNRATRVTELLLTAGERSLTIGLASAVLVLFLAHQANLSRGLVGPWRALGVPRAAWLIVLAMLLTAGIDLKQRSQAQSLRSRMASTLETQFTLFADLNPPSVGAHSPEGYLPESATALQIGGTVVAIDGAPFALHDQAVSPAGTLDTIRALGQKLARHAADGHGAAKLSLTIDARVPWPTVRGFLVIARAAGARDIVVLLTRGETPRIPRDASPETSWIVASDFVAVPLAVFEENIPSDAEATFGELAPRALDAVDWARTAPPR